MDAPRDDPSGTDGVSAALESFDRALARPLDHLSEGLGRLGSSAPARGLAFLCDDLRRLTGRYRDYLRAIEPHRTAKAVPLRLSDLLAEVDRRAAPRARDRGTSWLCTLDGPDDEVRGDPEFCAEVLEELALNALTFTPAGGAVRVTARAEAAAWTLRVIDTGPGIPADRRDRLFEPFERLSRDVEAEIPGAGLGLALCRALVARMGGSITLDPLPEGGTCATVVLPRA